MLGRPASVGISASSHPIAPRAALVVGTVLAIAAALAWSPAAPSGMDADLARLLRFMALLKGVFATVAVAAAWWRLARPAAGWRLVTYVAGPALMAGGSTALGLLAAPWLATVGLHAGMLALLAAALTDEAFIPARRRANGLG